MKDYFLKKLKRWLIFILVFLLLIGGYVLFRYNQSPQGLADDITKLYNKVVDMSGEYYGVSTIQENIELPEKELLTEAQRYYYYQQLSEPAKKIYVTIENNVDKMLNGEENIELPPSLNDLAKKEGKEKVAKEFQNAWDAFITDKSEYFYLDSSKVCLVTKITTRGSTSEYQFAIGKGDNKTYFIDEFNSKEDVEIALKQIDKEAEAVIKNATGNNYQKMRYIHDEIVDNTNYETQKKGHTANIYGCIVNKRAICEGYARAFKYYMDKLDIPCVLVSGDAVDEKGNTERHAWNYVYINNNWYAIDTTWDDPIIIGNGTITDRIKYKYFLKGSETMKKDHITSGQITENGKVFEYPELAKDDLIE
jgi:transglutaminase-like putative cysteine protease